LDAVRRKGWKSPLAFARFDRTFHFYETQGFDVAGGKKMKVLL
jgi:hypothetical protein